MARFLKLSKTMELRRLPQAIGFKRLFIQWTAVSVFALSSTAWAVPKECIIALQQKQTDVPTHKTSNLYGSTFDYTEFQKKGFYNVATDLPNLKDAFLIHIDQGGHTMIWYKGVRVDSAGKPGLLKGIKEFSRKLSNLRRGIVFAIHNLPSDFDEKFQTYLSQIDTNSDAMTCAGATCAAVNDLGIHTKKTILTSRLMKYFFTLDSKTKESFGLEIVVLGVDINRVNENVYNRESNFVMAHVMGSAIFGFGGLMSYVLYSLLSNAPL